MQPLLNQTQINYRIFFVASILTMLVMFFPTASASFHDFPAQMVEQIESGVSKSIIDNFSSDSELFKYMTATNSSQGILKDLGPFIKVMKLCGIFTAMLIAVVHMFENINKGQNPTEEVLKVFVEMFLTALIIVNLDAILSWMATLVSEIFIGNNFSTTGVTTRTNSSTAEILEALTGKSEGKALWAITTSIMLLIPYVVSYILQIVSYLICFSIIFEIGVRRVFAPFAIADIYAEGIRSPGFRYLKKYLASIIKMAVCLAICSLGKFLQYTILGSMGMNVSGGKVVLGTGDMGKYLLATIALNVTMIGVMLRAGSFADDIAGV